MSENIDLEAVAVLRGLRAVRQFDGRALPSPVVQDILDVIRWSGNASNRQQFQVLWTEDRALLRQLAECEGYARHLAGAAGGAVIVTWMERDELNAFDEGRIAERIMLTAHAHGVGSCIGWFTGDGRAAAQRLLGLGPETTVRTAISLGYATEGARRGARRKQLDELVRRI